MRMIQSLLSALSATALLAGCATDGSATQVMPVINFSPAIALEVAHDDHVHSDGCGHEDYYNEEEGHYVYWYNERYEWYDESTGEWYYYEVEESVQ